MYMSRYSSGDPHAGHFGFASQLSTIGISMPPMIPLPFVRLYLMDHGASRPSEGQVPINVLTGQVQY